MPRPLGPADRPDRQSRCEPPAEMEGLQAAGRRSEPRLRGKSKGARKADEGGSHENIGATLSTDDASVVNGATC